MLSYRDIPNFFTSEAVYDEAVRRATSPATFVEVGTWFGASTIYLATQIRSSGKSIKLFAIDNFTADGSGPALGATVARIGGNFFDLFCCNLRAFGVIDLVHPLIGDSTTLAERFNATSVDFVYIDACHDYPKVRMDILAWLPRVRPGGTIAGHDYDESHGGVTKAVDEIFGTSIVRHIGNSWWVDIPESGGLSVCATRDSGINRGGNRGRRR
jgi:hypothetical protein